MLADEGRVPPTGDHGAPRKRQGSERLALAVPLVAVGVCCATTVAGVTVGAGVLTAAAGMLAGLGVLAIPMALAVAVAFGVHRSRRATGARG